MEKITINLEIDHGHVKEMGITKVCEDRLEIALVDIPHDFSVDDSINKIKEYIN